MKDHLSVEVEQTHEVNLVKVTFTPVADISVVIEDDEDDSRY